MKNAMHLLVSLLYQSNPVLNAIGKRIPYALLLVACWGFFYDYYFTHSDRYEIAVGLNGRVWVHSGSVTNTILIANAIINSEQLPAKHVESMVQQLLQRAEKQ